MMMTAGTAEMKVCRGDMKKKDEKDGGKVAVLGLTLVNGKEDNLDSSVRLTTIG